MKKIYFPCQRNIKIPLGHVGAPQPTTRNRNHHCDVINDVESEIYDADDVKH